MAFGLGIMAGVPTALLLVYQGLMFGAFVALHHDRGLLVDFLGWVSIHGVTEFGALILCSAGGLIDRQAICCFPVAIRGWKPDRPWQTAASLAAGRC